jgi:hypothetical protein
MKNVFFALAFMLVGTFAFANTDLNINEKVNEVEFSAEIQIEILGNIDSISEDVPCRWRTCRYKIVDGERVLIGCSGWTYGDCSDDGNGGLTPGPSQLPEVTVNG